MYDALLEVLELAPGIDVNCEFIQAMLDWIDAHTRRCFELPKAAEMIWRA
jgi:hypothetical protein